ncbi:efflux RND transporter periplasmic adaptor subunit [Shewanella eurypsychrophilus]|uniref:Efflux RND transporter periplasmic adaptor subunit n=1 Tax=Shewanella eurypsychrophilus TaxID=2593656 RepID=A0ABX6VAF3_9GAMM|nr:MULTISPECIES: efflux RND transporter periplasmic adaptor subunit [Shewanella]QFU23774.1 efflux RND transporter periplasmic adaptor subunit [Shewanella sp. YLB-09]QPG58997.1 efflux RND transporter periplasmic adaptor subunit [Shewanella eurypsychrophilus]
MAYLFNKMKFLCFFISLTFFVTACGESVSNEQDFGDGTFANTANVATIDAQFSEVTLYDELQGRVRPLRSAEIRPQVTGIIIQRLFRQGDTLTHGDPLFQIDQDAFEIDIDIKQAALSQSLANLALLQTQLNRLATLDRTEAVSKQAFEDASFNQQIAAATVEQNRAQLEHSKLQLKYARVSAPISGIIGEALVTEGALVISNDAKPMAVIQQIDKVYIDVRQPASKLSQIRKFLDGKGSNNKQGLAVTVQFSENRAEDIKGSILFSGISVDENTGDLIVRIIADNPNQLLLPGMYVRTQIPRRKLQAVRIPEQAVLRTSSGDPYLFVVVDGNYERRELVIEGIQSGEYLVSQGLSNKDTVIVSGQENLQQGAQLSLSTWLK